MFKSKARNAAIGGGSFFLLVVVLGDLSRVLSLAIVELTQTSPSGIGTFLSLRAEPISNLVMWNFEEWGERHNACE